MAHSLTTAITLPNITRLVVGRPTINDDDGVMHIPISLRTPGATDYVVDSIVVAIRNGLSDRLVRTAFPFPGMPIGGLVSIQTSAVSTPTGFTDAVAAWAGGGAGAGGKRTALEGALRTLGIIDPTTLAGS